MADKLKLQQAVITRLMRDAMDNQGMLAANTASTMNSIAGLFVLYLSKNFTILQIFDSNF